LIKSYAKTGTCQKNTQVNGQHNYTITIKWTGNIGDGTSNYRSYERSHTITVNNKAGISGSSDPAFRGDKTKYNPEELLVASLSACHMLSYLHVCAVAGIIVTDYIDNATGIMVETSNGGGHFTEVTLNPSVTITESHMVDKANELHKKANELCFIANSVKFPVHHRPTCKTVTK
jgi:organic hydroperoxide reductase OsmC/OhrA